MTANRNPATARNHNRAHPDIRITVLAEDIQCGLKESKDSCTIAHAIKREMSLAEEGGPHIHRD